MAKAKADIKGLSVPDKIARGRQLESALKGNTGLPPGTGDEQAAKIKLATDDLQLKYNAQLDNKNVWSISVDVQNSSSDNWDATLNNTVTVVDEASGGDPEIILSTGLKLAESTGHALPAPLKVTNLHLSVGDEPGHVDAAWDGQPNATGYAAQIWLGEDVMQAQWNYGPPVKGKKSKLEITNQPSGSRLWLRVQALNTQSGPWSDPISIIIP